MAGMLRPRVAVMRVWARMAGMLRLRVAVMRVWARMAGMLRLSVATMRGWAHGGDAGVPGGSLGVWSEQRAVVVSQDLSDRVRGLFPQLAGEFCRDGD